MSRLLGWLEGSDPLRSRTGRMVAGWLMLAVVLGGGVYGVFRYKKQHFRAPDGTVKEPKTKLSPDFLRGAELLVGNAELEVSDAGLVRGPRGMELRATLRNHTDRPIYGIRCSFDVTDNHGQHLGAVAAAVPSVSPYGSAPVRIDVPYRGAYFATLREIRPR